MLAAYSLALTVLNGRWIARRFSKHKHPKVRNAIQVLSSLQQAPLRVNNDGALLASLITLPENDEWWKQLIEWLARPHTWSISAFTSIAWVVIAYTFTLIDSFTGELADVISADGQSVGSLWLWLLPIVIGWLQISPKCDEVRVRSAVEKANNIAYRATDTDPVLVKKLTEEEERAIYLAFGEEDDRDDVLRRDERITAPIYNYARFLPWVKAVEEVSKAFGAASEVARGDRIGPHTFGTKWGPDVFSRIAIASALAFMLQWGTVGAAFIVVYFTPTTGEQWPFLLP
jgi:hypothetical protein